MGALYKLNKHIPKSALMAVYYSLVYSHLLYAIICWGNNSKHKIHKLQVKQNKIVKIIEKRFGKEIRLKSLFNNLQLLNINGIYKLEILFYSLFMLTTCSITLTPLQYYTQVIPV